MPLEFCQHHHTCLVGTGRDPRQDVAVALSNKLGAAVLRRDVFWADEVVQFVLRPKTFQVVDRGRTKASTTCRFLENVDVQLINRTRRAFAIAR